jgi:hypothetical protein
MGLAWRGEDGLRLRVGADMVGVAGKLRAGDAQAPGSAFDPAANGSAPLAVIDAVYASASGRNAMGAYAELALSPLSRVETAFGARADLWLTGSESQAAVSPRAVVTYFAAPAVDLHAGIALSHQPAVFLLPLPGVSDIALTHGLQSAIQGELGAAAEPFEGLRAELQLYAHRYGNLLFPELALEEAAACARPYTLPSDDNLCDQPAPYPRASALAYGLEVMLRSSARHRLSGWLAYTLGRATAEADAGFAFTPSFDLRHVGNLVLHYRVFGGFSLGARSFVRSGQVMSRVVETGQRVARRLPGSASPTSSSASSG